MFDIKESGTTGSVTQIGNAGPGLASRPLHRPARLRCRDRLPVPLERLEAQICEVAGHLAAATCRFLVLLADFDARRGWARGR